MRFTLPQGIKTPQKVLKSFDISAPSPRQISSPQPPKIGRKIQAKQYITSDMDLKDKWEKVIS